MLIISSSSSVTLPWPNISSQHCLYSVRVSTSPLFCSKIPLWLQESSHLSPPLLAFFVSDFTKTTRFTSAKWTSSVYAISTRTRLTIELTYWVSCWGTLCCCGDAKKVFNIISCWCSSHFLNLCFHIWGSLRPRNSQNFWRDWYNWCSSATFPSLMSTSPLHFPRTDLNKPAVVEQTTYGIKINKKKTTTFPCIAVSLVKFLSIELAALQASAV